MSRSTKSALAIVVVLALAGAFWLLLLGPKREKASELAEQTSALRGEVATERQRALAALDAKREFPRYYRELVLLGKAVPAEAATPSLLVQLNGVSAHADTRFQSISLGGEGGGEAAAETGDPASLLPLGASIGPAGLSAMPYELEFEGGFFDIADFIEGLDSLVKTKNGVVDAKGRLVTIDSFNLAPVAAESSDAAASGSLAAGFSVSTYVTPPGQGLTAGATPSGPSTATTETP